MSKFFRFAAFAMLCLVALAGSSLRADEPTKIELAEGFLTLEVPADWKIVEPKSRIIEHEFQAPKEGDAVARVTIMAAGGSIDANIDRWYGQFTQPDGKATKEVAKLEKKEVAGLEVTMVDIPGTMSESMGGGPFAPGKTVKREGYRMLGAIINTKDKGLQFIKLTGANDVVEQQKKAFLALIESTKTNK